MCVSASFIGEGSFGITAVVDVNVADQGTAGTSLHACCLCLNYMRLHVSVIPVYSGCLRFDIAVQRVQGVSVKLVSTLVLLHIIM